MKRREFIAGLGVALAWPVVARGQPREQMRRLACFLDWLTVIQKHGHV